MIAQRKQEIWVSEAKGSMGSILFSAAVQPQQSPGGPEGTMRRRRVEIRQLHSSGAGEALTHLLQIQVDFYIFFSGID